MYLCCLLSQALGAPDGVPPPLLAAPSPATAATSATTACAASAVGASAATAALEIGTVRHGGCGEEKMSSRESLVVEDEGAVERCGAADKA